MAAVVGTIVHSNHIVFDGYISPSNNLKFSDIPTGIDGIFTVPTAGLAQIIAFVGFVELAWLPASQYDGDYGVGYFGGDILDPEEKARNFDYYDPITTGDSSLSACVQSIVAAAVGYEDLAVDYFRQALYLDLCDLHGNTSDGVHIASAGGVWAGIVHGFAGMVERGDRIEFTPRLPAVWQSVTFHLARHGSRVRVDLDATGCTLTLVSGLGVPVGVGDQRHVVTTDAPLRIAAAAR